MIDTDVGASLAHIGNYLSDMMEFYDKDEDLLHHLAHVYGEARKAEAAYWNAQREAQRAR